MVPDCDSTEQEELLLNTEENTNTTNTQPIENAQTKGPDTVERDELRKTGPTTKAEGADMGTTMATETTQDA